MKKTIIIGIVALIISGYIFASPYITVHQIKSAAKDRDSDSLSEHIEFPSVRQSFKDQLNALVMKEMGSDQMKNNPFAALGATFASTMVEKMVDAYITPSGMAQLMAGEEPAENPSNSSSTPSSEPLSDASMGYESINKFVVTIPAVNEKEGKLILRRHGIDWKLTEIIIPL